MSRKIVLVPWALYSGLWPVSACFPCFLQVHGEAEASASFPDDPFRLPLWEAQFHPFLSLGCQELLNISGARARGMWQTATVRPTGSPGQALRTCIQTACLGI